MALGKAFIEVHADTKPFARELEKELTRLTKSAEQGNLKNTGRKLGESLGDGISEGVERNRKKVGSSIQKSLKDAIPDAGESRGIFAPFAKGIIDTIDDGLSGLPGELKVVLGAALLAVTPFLGASIAAMVAGALIVGFAGLGTLFAFQFERVRTAGTELVSFMRNLFSNAAGSFIEPVLAGMRKIETAFTKLTPSITRIFQLASEFVAPLTDGLIGFFENLLPGVEQSMLNIRDSVDVLAFHFKFLGHVIGEALMIITESDNLDEGLNDFLTVLETVILASAILIRTLTEMYKWFKLTLALVAPLLTVAGAFEQVEINSSRAKNEIGGFQSTMQEALAPTEAEEKALKDVNAQLNEFVSLTASAWQSNINFEQALDDMTESLKKHRGVLNLDTQAGRDHQASILSAAEALQKQRERTILLTGDTAAANATFETNRKRLEAAAVAAGISAAKFHELTDQILTVPPVVSPMVSPAAEANVNRAIADWKELRQLINNANAAASRDVRSTPLGTMRGYADGGVITSPTVGLVGEAGPEAIIPLSNPARAAQVMNQAGLTGGGTTVVYIGNEQVDAYIDRRVDTRMSMTARAMSYGVRAI